MGVIASLDERDLTVEAGERATCSVRLHNAGHTVDTFTLDVLGEAAEWTSVQPESVNVFPGDDAVAVLTFAPPRSAEVPCGKRAFALRVMAQEDTDGSVIEEGSVDVAGYADLAVELVPRTARGARTARTRLAVDNFGNGPVTVQFTGKDESGDVDFRFKPAQTVVEGGTTQLIRVRMRMRKRFLTGQPKTLPVEISLTASDGTSLDTAGMVIQPPLLPRWLPKALTFLLAGVVLLLVLGPTVFNAAPKSKAASGSPPSTSGAEESPAPPTPTPSAGTTTPNPDATPTPGAPTGAGEQDQGDAKAPADNGAGPGGQADTGSGSKPASGAKPDTGGGSGGGTGGGSSGTPAKPPAPAPAKPPSADTPAPTTENIRIQGQATAGSAAFSALSRTVRAGQTVTVKEVILDNPPGTTGTLEIRKNSTVLLTRPLEKLTHERYRFPAEVTFKAGDAITVAVRCTTASGKCTPTALFPAQVTGG